MRILIPAFTSPDSFADNVSTTFSAMGHDVRTLGTVSNERGWKAGAYVRQLSRDVLGDRPSRTDYAILKLARSFKPDLILSVTGLLHPSVLDELGSIAPGRRILWWGDAPANSQRWGILDPGWDFVYLKDRAAQQKLLIAGSNAHFLHEAMNPTWHKPLAEQKNECVVIAGNYYAFRQAITLRLMRDGVSFQLYGPSPPTWAHPLIKEKHLGKYLVGEEKSRAFGEGLACLNTFSPSEGDSLNCRAFEVAGAGGLQIIEYRSAIEECFEPGTELLTFKSYDELLELINRARKNPAEMTTIRQAGAKRAWADHTYEHRLRVILKNL